MVVSAPPPPNQPVVEEKASRALAYEQAISQPERLVAPPEEGEKSEAVPNFETKTTESGPDAPVTNSEQSPQPDTGTGKPADQPALANIPPPPGEGIPAGPAGPDEGWAPPDEMVGPPPPGSSADPYADPYGLPSPSASGDPYADPYGPPPDSGPYANVTPGPEAQQPWHRQNGGEQGPGPWGEAPPGQPRQYGEDGYAPWDDLAGQLSSGQESVEWVQVVLSGAAMRATASDDAPMLFAFPYGRSLQVISRYEDWVQVTDPQSAATGWMKLQYVAPVQAYQGYDQREAYYGEPPRRRGGWLRRNGEGIADMIGRAFGGGGF